MARKRKRFEFFSAFAFADGMSKVEMVALCFVSAFCAACNVLLPYLQKVILESIGNNNNTDDLLWVYLLVGIGGALALTLENFLNIAIMMRLRRGLERAMLYSITYKEQPMIREKGIGVFSSAIVGDAEQLSRVLAAGWFSIIFNFIGAIVSIIISATWNQYFLVIVMAAYLLVLIVIYVFNRISVHYFRKEKVISYAIGPHIRGTVESHRSIMAFGSYDAYQESLRPEYELRRKYFTLSENMASLSSALIKLIQAVALAVFFFFAVAELQADKTPEERAAFYPVLVALVSYFATIFAPIASINTTYNNVSKFRAFFDPFRDIVTFPGLGGLPGYLDVKVDHVEAIHNNVLTLENIDLELDKVYAIIGLRGESKAALLGYLRGETVPEHGAVTMGGVPFHEIEKNLRLSLFSINSSGVEILDNNLEFNVTLGKPLLSDIDYEQKRKEYYAHLEYFFELVDSGCSFHRKKEKSILDEIISDFYALDPHLRNEKLIRDTVVAAFACIEDRAHFIATIGNSIFSKKYAKRARYEKIFDGLSLYSLEHRDIGYAGKNLLESERALILLARFLLPENENPFLLLSPLEHVPFELYASALSLLQKMIKGRPGLVIMPDINDARTIADEMIVMEGATIIERGKHANLLRRKSKYAEIYAEANKPVRKK